jgi:hypothetical protein
MLGLQVHDLLYFSLAYEYCQNDLRLLSEKENVNK